MLFVEISFFFSVLQQSVIAVTKFEWHCLFIYYHIWKGQWSLYNGHLKNLQKLSRSIWFTCRSSVCVADIYCMQCVGCITGASKYIIFCSSVLQNYILGYSEVRKIWLSQLNLHLKVAGVNLETNLNIVELKLHLVPYYMCTWFVIHLHNFILSLFYHNHRLLLT